MTLKYITGLNCVQPDEHAVKAAFDGRGPHRFAVTWTRPDNNYERAAIGYVTEMEVRASPQGSVVQVHYFDLNSGAKSGVRILNFYYKPDHPLGAGWYSTSTWRKLIVARGEEFVGTPREEPAPAPAPVAAPAQPKPPKNYGDFITKSDELGIDELLKKGFKDIFGGSLPVQAAPKKPPSYAGLVLQTSEKYFNMKHIDDAEKS